MLNVNDDSRPSYAFTPLTEEGEPFPPSLQSRDARDHLLKWNLDKGLTFYRFKFLERFRPGTDTEAFLLDFFKSKAVKDVFGASKDPLNVEYEKLSTKIMSMDFFDRLEEGDITAGGEGYIRKCLDEDFHGVLVGDKLREMLVNEDSENFNVFGEEEQRELIFQVFKLLAIGGGMCQCEDTVNPYLDATKTLYKDLVAVQKSNKTGEVEVVSAAYSIDKVLGDSELGYQLYERQSPYNKTLVIVDPIRKIATVVKHDFQPFW